MFIKSSILDVRLSSEYASEKGKEFRSALESTIKTNTERAKQL